MHSKQKNNANFSSKKSYQMNAMKEETNFYKKFDVSLRPAVT